MNPNFLEFEQPIADLEAKNIMFDQKASLYKKEKNETNLKS